MISPDSGRQWRSPVCPCLSRIPDLARPILAYYGILARKLLLHQRCLRDTDNQNDRVDGSPGDGDIEGKTSFCLSPTLTRVVACRGWLPRFTLQTSSNESGRTLSPSVRTWRELTPGSGSPRSLRFSSEIGGRRRRK